ncbi:unnamed protein product [Cutaneotrichosporon oleaginosum]
MSQTSFPLSHSILTSSRSTVDSDHAFPRLKVRCTPRVSLPTLVAPLQPKPKPLEETIKVVAQLGAKIVLAWSVNTASLGTVDALPNGAQEAIERHIGGWIIKNQAHLGIEDAAWELKEDGTKRSNSLLLKPISASPSRSPTTTYLIPSGEPTAALVKVDLAFWWHMQGKRKAEELDGDDSRDNLVADAVEEALKPSNSNIVAHASGQHAVEAIMFGQIAEVMPVVLRQQLLRRFPYVFDGPFLDYQTHCQLLPSLITAMRSFAFNAARHRPEFIIQCGGIISRMEESRQNLLDAQVKAVALLPTRKKPAKRKVQGQDEPQVNEDIQESRQQLEEDAGHARAAGAIEAVAKDEAGLADRQRLHRLIAEKVAAVGASKWLEIRRKGGRMGASRAAVRLQ